MADLVTLKRTYPNLSLRAFARLVEMPYWRLRDFIHRDRHRQRRAHRNASVRAAVKRVALTNPTFGYRRISIMLTNEGLRVGRHKVRVILRELELVPITPRKRRNSTVNLIPPPVLPPGRRLQIDATRVAMPKGSAWVYLVQDVASRACLAIRPVFHLSKDTAVEVLNDAIAVLREVGIRERIVVQSDAGSDFTSHVFQEYCCRVGCWVRSRVNVKGGMGILERLNRTFKYDWCFREQPETLLDLVVVTQAFREWYNRERPHSTLGYDTPWSRLVAG